jgi:hypothetical protein
MWDVPPLAEPFALRGRRDAAVVLDAFTPTHLDAWTGRAFVDGRALRCVVVRHAGDVRGRGRRGLATVWESAPPPEPVLGIVVEERGPTLVWLPPGEHHARDLSRRDWRAFV